jgi:hypothetical protein
MVTENTDIKKYQKLNQNLNLNLNNNNNMSSGK